MNLGKLAEICIVFYQKAISPYFPHSCRYVPTCSEYAREAFKKYPFCSALLKSSWRLLRCNSFSQGGEDYLK